ncbi:hypothetical protein NQZ68_039008 [Dissostichus eleginoides]|nr:hypothetical protein NQZ68_039008 [Dissostichus eleginoides]
MVESGSAGVADITPNILQVPQHVKTPASERICEMVESGSAGVADITPSVLQVPHMSL